MAVVSIELPHHAYDVTIEPGAIGRLGSLVRERAPHARCALVADRAAIDPWGVQARESLAGAGYAVSELPLDSGERLKTLETVAGMYAALVGENFERGSPLVALGGGVTGDTAGFVAATYLRGLPFVQCPTTLLAMVDASVGGKVGVNLPQGKNLVGAFHQPVAVVIDPRVLGSLPERELRCGLAECIKHGLIADPGLLDLLESRMDRIRALDPDEMTELVRRNVAVKAGVVMADEREAGVRASLNLGHTFGHAIETCLGYGEVLHGEAVGLGMIAAAGVARRLGLCGAALVERLRALVAAAGLDVRRPLPGDAELGEAMRRDKKVAGGRVRFVLPKDEGGVELRDDVSERDVSAGWAEIRA